MELKIATIDDIDATLKLHRKYHLNRISTEDKKDGFLTIDFTKEKLTQLIIEENGLFILKEYDEVLAYVMAGSWDFWSEWNLFENMIKGLSNLEYLGEELTAKNSYQYGSVCIDTSLRGLGILEKMFNFSKEIMKSKYPILVTFINKNNRRSFNAHYKKLGLDLIDEFSFDGEEYYTLAYDTSKSIGGKGVIAVVDSPIEYLSYEMLLDKDYLENNIYKNMNQHYYWSDDFSAKYYIAQAKAGFISVTMEQNGSLYLTPEIQKEYAVLDFKDLHVSKKVRKLLNKKDLKIEIGYDFDELFFKIKEQHVLSWLRIIYLETLKEVNSLDDNCHVITTVIRDNHEIISGEIGYIIGKSYTSLTGFSSRKKEYSNYGTAQIVLLAQYLESNGFDFLNLGQPYMQYKLDLGAKVYSREEFLKRWMKSITL